MSLQVYEDGGSLTDPQYVRTLVADMTAYEKASGTDPETLSFKALADIIEHDIAEGRYDPEGSE